MGWKYTVKGWNYEDGEFYYAGSNNIFGLIIEYFKIPKKATVKYIEIR